MVLRHLPCKKKWYEEHGYAMHTRVHAFTLACPSPQDTVLPDTVLRTPLLSQVFTPEVLIPLSQFISFTRRIRRCVRARTRRIW